MKIDPYYQQQKCRPYVTVCFWRYKVYTNIRGRFLGRDVKRQWCCRERQVSAFSLTIFPETLDMRPALLYSDMQSVISFSAIPKCTTLNDLESLFRIFALNSVFAPVLLAPTVQLSKNNCVKINKDRYILSAALIFGRDSSFWQYKVCADIRSGSLHRIR